MTVKNITKLHELITDSLFTINTPLDYGRITDAFITLCNALGNTDTDESVWYIGECSYVCLGDLIAGAYWHYSEWHSGQWSQSYAALCALGRIYSPGMTDGPEDDTSEQDVYTELHNMAEAYH